MSKKAKVSATRKPVVLEHVKGLRLIQNEDSTFTDQYGRLLEQYTNKQGKPDLRPIGLDRRGAKH